MGQRDSLDKSQCKGKKTLRTSDSDCHPFDTLRVVHQIESWKLLPPPWPIIPFMLSMIILTCLNAIVFETLFVERLKRRPRMLVHPFSSHDDDSDRSMTGFLSKLSYHWIKDPIKNAHDPQNVANEASYWAPLLPNAGPNAPHSVNPRAPISWSMSVLPLRREC